MKRLRPIFPCISPSLLLPCLWPSHLLKCESLQSSVKLLLLVPSRFQLIHLLWIPRSHRVSKGLSAIFWWFHPQIQRHMIPLLVRNVHSAQDHDDPYCMLQRTLEQVTYNIIFENKYNNIMDKMCGKITSIYMKNGPKRKEFNKYSTPICWRVVQKIKDRFKINVSTWKYPYIILLIQKIMLENVPISSPVWKSYTWIHISSPPAMNLFPYLGSSEADSTVQGIL